MDNGITTPESEVKTTGEAISLSPANAMPRKILLGNLGRIHDDRDAIAAALKSKGFLVEYINIKEKTFEKVDFKDVAAVELKGCRGWQKYVHFFKGQLEVLQSKIAETGRSIPIINPPAMFHWIDSKEYMKELKDAGVAIVQTTFVSPKEKLPNIIKMMDENPVKTIVIKPAIGSLAANVIFITKKADNNFSITCPNPIKGEIKANLLDADERYLKRFLKGYVHEMFQIEKQPSILVQQFCEGLETSAIFINDKAHFVKRFRADEGFVAHEDFGGQNIVDKNPDQRLVELANNVRNSLPDHIKTPPFMRVDMLFDGKNPPLLLEVEAGSARLFLRIARKVDSYAKMIQDEVVKSREVNSQNKIQDCNLR